MAIETSNECMSVAQAEILLQSGVNCRGVTNAPPKFQVGDMVKAKVMHPVTYTRLPRYVRGKVGTIAKVHGVYVFPDTIGQRLDTKPQYVYNVRFAAQDIWGPDASPKDFLHIDLFDDHLDTV
ncbi:SH3-like domain-containing protein [Nodosilinea sp. P-1105]|uniref:SH3-like domain-containing protein n=1 Tax=Nodosilinea sp. P-1105 TaxID=2546229 RepID=UPI00146D758F|nr:SH3-like domain-containing protein [Nodosilinea sp. P-1105]NMF85039.1 nitrile hydratase subunit beta [Nodosilinea sp. P-1105]